MQFVFIIGLVVGVLLGSLITRLFFQSEVNSFVKIHPSFFKVFNRNKHSPNGSDFYYGVDIKNHKALGCDELVRYMFTEHEIEVAKRRAEKNKDEDQPKKG